MPEYVYQMRLEGSPWIDINKERYERCLGKKGWEPPAVARRILEVRFSEHNVQLLEVANDRADR